MGRKPNPRGKDRTRTISLDGDVAEIAQELADKSQLSKVLSELLRSSAGLTSQVELMKDELNAIVDERRALDERARSLEDAIDKKEAESLKIQSEVLPGLYHQRDMIAKRIEKLKDQRSRLFSPNEITIKTNQIEESSRTWEQLKLRIETYESETSGV